MSSPNNFLRLARWAGVIALAVAVAAPVIASATDRDDDIARVESAANVYRSVMSMPDKAIPDAVLNGAQCIVIIPGEKNFALGFGGIYGKGVASCRSGKTESANATGNWSAPFFVTLAGGSWGAQIGAESSDIIMVFQNRSALDAMLNTKVRIGAGASAAAGPIGRQVGADTNLQLAPILTYARSKGLFAGIDLNGAEIKPDDSANNRMYGTINKTKVLSGDESRPTWAKPLLRVLDNPATSPTNQ